jgi:hypothetical protein
MERCMVVHASHSLSGGAVLSSIATSRSDDVNGTGWALGASQDLRQIW